MAVTVTSNKKNKSIQVHFNANGTIVVAGNSSVVANATQTGIATGDEVTTGAVIRQVFAGCDGTGSIQVARGGQVVAVYDSTGWYDYAGCGMPLSVNKTSNVNVTFVGSANCYLYMELSKDGGGSSEYLVG